MQEDFIEYTKIARMELRNDEDLTILYASKSFYSMLGYKKEEYDAIYGNKLINILNKNNKLEVLETIRNKNKKTSFFDVKIKSKSDKIFFLSVFCFFKEHPLNEDNSEIIYLTISDRTEYTSKLSNKINKLEELKNTDHLTKIYNKGAIENKINDMLLKFPNKKYAFCIIDLDFFKTINDTFGHLFGDRVLQEFVDVIVKITSRHEKEHNGTSLLGRIGGDEFILLMEYKDVSTVLQSMELINKDVKNIYISDKEQYKVTASIGICLFPENGQNYIDLIKTADIALYNVKYNGKNGFKLFDNSLSQIEVLTAKSISGKGTAINQVRTAFDVINLFNDTKNFKLSIQTAVESICKLYKFDRSCILIKNAISDTFNKIFEYNMNQYSKNMSDEITFDKNLDTIIVDSRKPRFVNTFSKIYKGQKYLYTDMPTNVLNTLKNIKFEEDSDFEPFELYSYYFDNPSYIIGYVTFEKYNSSEKLTSIQVEELNTICSLINSKINENLTKIKLMKEAKIYQIMLTDKETSISVIKKNTYELLYFNNVFSKNKPSTNLGEVCEESQDFLEYCKEYYFNNNVTDIEQFFSNNPHFNLKCDSITWEDNLDAYVVYGEKAVDIAEIAEEVSNEEFSQIDLLTKAPTTEKFKANFNKNIKPKLGKGSTYTLFVMDIEKFNFINNIHGYVIGDEILKKFSNTLKNFLKLDEIFCRIGEDKFGLIVSSKGNVELSLRIKNLNNMLIDMQDIHFNDVNITVICGICKIDDDTRDLTVILDKANIARKSAKGSLDNVFKVYDQSLNNFIEKQNFIEERALLGLKNNEFIPFLQPKFNLYTNELCGAEALVRWQSYDRMIYPDEFVDIFEKNGFIEKVDFLMYEQVLKYIEDCLNKGLNIVPISLNVSKGHLKDIYFSKKILELCSTYNVPLKYIEMEIVENAFNENFDLVKKFIEDLRNNGIQVAIDDFGTSYSSLNTLKDLEVDIVKLDRGFLKNAEKVKDDESLLNKNRIIISHIVKMCNDLNIGVICEGIETLEQMRFLRDIGCEYGQGYLFSKAIPIDEFNEKFLY